MLKAISDYRVKELELKTKGVGSGRDVFIRKILLEKSLQVTALIDKTPSRHGGCRPRKIPRK